MTLPLYMGLISLTSWTAVVAVGIALAILLLFRRHRPRLQQPSVASPHGRACDDPGCVRCSRYTSVLQKAQQRSARLGVSRRLATAVRLAVNQGTAVDADDHDGCLRRDGLASWKASSHPTVLRVAGLRAKEFWDDLAANVQGWTQQTCFIQTALDELRAIPTELWTRNRTPHGIWRTLWLVNQGVPQSEVYKRMPQTTKLIDSFPDADLRTCFGNVLISAMEPGTEVKPHYGPTNTRLRCHITLEEGGPSAKLTVGRHSRGWSRKLPLVFDDSFLHSVTYPNPSGVSASHHQLPTRIVVIIDVFHPDLTQQERQDLTDIFRL